MNAMSPTLSVPAALPAAMARDLLGATGPARFPIAHHTALSSLDTRGPLSLLDSTAPAGAAFAAHIHPAEDEILIVLSGELELCLGQRTLRCRAGTSTFIPRGTEHSVRALTEVRTIAILTRQSLEAQAA